VLVPALKDTYDLILTFDYENINTTIEDNARLLKMRLEEVGLGASHGKTLHIAAHSMGGLVSRWFIEREGGNKVVNHLVMLGTPNGGSPWATIQDMATAALGMALNSIAAVVWPVKVLGTLVSAIETIDVSLDQMKPGSDFLKNLASSPDPGVPYTIIAGQTSIIQVAAEGGENSLLAKLWRKIKPQSWMYDMADMAFFQTPNDIAASVDSIYAVPANRNPAPLFLPPVACDHLSYFNTNAGLTALTEILAEKENLAQAAGGS
jgi:pimeloyl-ACP methyl ester carboxylesterase